MPTVTTPPPFHAVPWPPIRNAIAMLMQMHKPSTCYGHGEIDLTLALDRIRQKSKELRIAVSLHAFLIYCLAQAVERHPIMNSYRYKNQRITFDDVDVGTAVDRKLSDGQRIPVGYVVRAAQRKSLAEINWELRQTLRTPMTDLSHVRIRRRIARWPAPLRWLAGRVIGRNPFLLKKVQGTVGMTSLKSANLPFPFYPHPPNIFTFTFAIGSVLERFVPAADGSLSRRMIGAYVGAMDHIIVDGMPLAAFGATLAALIQSGAGLDDSFDQQTRALLAAEAAEP